MEPRFKNRDEYEKWKAEKLRVPSEISKDETNKQKPDSELLSESGQGLGDFKEVLKIKPSGGVIAIGVLSIVFGTIGVIFVPIGLMLSYGQTPLSSFALLRTPIDILLGISLIISGIWTFTLKRWARTLAVICALAEIILTVFGLTLGLLTLPQELQAVGPTLPMVASGGMIGGAIGGLAYPVVLLIFYFRASTKKQFVRAIEVAGGASFKNKHPWAMASLLTVITFFFLILSIGVISKYQRATTSKDRGWKLYSNKAYNVAFYYPESWLIGDSQKLHLQVTPPLVMIYDPVENVEQFSSNINLLVQHSPYLAQSAEDQANATVIWFQQIGNSMGMKDFEKLSYEPIANKFGNTKAGLSIYEYTLAQNDKRLKVMQLIIPKGGITYWLTFTSTPTMWDAYKPVFDKIVSSFALQ